MTSGHRWRSIGTHTRIRAPSPGAESTSRRPTTDGVVVQVAGLAGDAFGLPGWFEPMVWVLCGLGLPLALVLAWAFEMTPEGVQRTPSGEGGEPARTAYDGIGVWAVGLLALLAAGGGAWYLAGGSQCGATGGAVPAGDTESSVGPERRRQPARLHRRPARRQPLTHGGAGTHPLRWSVTNR